MEAAGVGDIDAFLKDLLVLASAGLRDLTWPCCCYTLDASITQDRIFPAKDAAKEVRHPQSQNLADSRMQAVALNGSALVQVAATSKSDEDLVCCIPWQPQNFTLLNLQSFASVLVCST